MNFLTGTILILSSVAFCTLLARFAISQVFRAAGMDRRETTTRPAR